MTESPARTLVKALSWQALGVITTAALAWMFTGSITAGVSLALSSALSGTAFFFLHERLWQRVRWGR
ncbi:DUF2061 domain-containing protein [Pseudohoeflea coraliihabitans]|uniref:DUF2061 domain-containing protein n=1 Tax=Pseudohoeflea coraliihabitans TaxID=2860393 RepID=A0ABS6WL91_9HYPH|nr:DUF2061 domain-containing protein [Pseudohoeflea sp. DP4N28-3]